MPNVAPWSSLATWAAATRPPRPPRGHGLCGCASRVARRRGARSSPQAPRPQPRAARGCPVGQTGVVAAFDAGALVSCRSALEAHGVVHDAGLVCRFRSDVARAGKGGAVDGAPARGLPPRTPDKVEVPPVRSPSSSSARCGGAGWCPAAGPRPTRSRPTRRGPPPTSTSRAPGRRAGTRCLPAGQPSGGRPAGSPALGGYATSGAQGGHGGRTLTPRHGSQWGPDHAKVDCVHTNRPPPMPIERRTSPLRPAAMGPM